MMQIESRKRQLRLKGVGRLILAVGILGAVSLAAADDQAFEFNATDVVLGNITINQAVAGQTLAAQTGAFNGDDTGNFSFGTACTTCGDGASDKFNTEIVFHVANATIADISAQNNLSNIFVADILNCDSTLGGGGCSELNGTGNTRAVDANGDSRTPRAPEQSNLILLGVGFLSVGFVISHLVLKRRIKRNRYFDRLMNIRMRRA